jgi:enoyl-CoA hydratase/carnithine racemase
VEELQVVALHGFVEARLKREHRANALSEALVERLLELVDACATDGTSLLVLRGEGSHFCAGFDLGDLDRQTDADLLWRMVRLETLLQKIHHAPFVTMALAHGTVVGAGVDLVCACSRRVAAPGSTFRMPGWRFGVALGTRRLIARVGSDAARSVLIDTRCFDVEEAIEIGLIDELASPEAWDERIASAARAAAALDPTSRAELLRMSVPDTRAEDMASLVTTAGKPGLRDRIAAFRREQKVARGGVAHPRR